MTFAYGSHSLTLARYALLARTRTTSRQQTAWTLASPRNIPHCNNDRFWMLKNCDASRQTQAWMDCRRPSRLYAVPATCYTDAGRRILPATLPAYQRSVRSRTLTKNAFQRHFFRPHWTEHIHSRGYVMYLSRQRHRTYGSFADASADGGRPPVADAGRGWRLSQLRRRGGRFSRCTPPRRDVNTFLRDLKHALWLGVVTVGRTVGGTVGGTTAGVTARLPGLDGMGAPPAWLACWQQRHRDRVTTRAAISR